ncbi:MAG: TetR/AcrR family transcriptional regulator [Pseudomonadota bacterium]
MKTDDKPKTQRQLAAEDRRKHIIRTAAICFIEDGFHQTSMRDIATAAGTSLGNLYNHFAGKTDLIAEIAGLEADELSAIRAILSQETVNRDTLTTFISAYFAYVSRPENAVLTAEITAEAMRSPQIVAGFAENSAKTKAGLVRLLDALPGPFEEPSEKLANLILTTVEASATRAAFLPPAEKKAQLETLLSVFGRVIPA